MTRRLSPRRSLIHNGGMNDAAPTDARPRGLNLLLAATTLLSAGCCFKSSRWSPSESSPGSAAAPRSGRRPCCSFRRRCSSATCTRTWWRSRCRRERKFVCTAACSRWPPCWSPPLASFRPIAGNRASPAALPCVFSPRSPPALGCRISSSPRPPRWCKSGSAAPIRAGRPTGFMRFPTSARWRRCSAIRCYLNPILASSIKARPGLHYSSSLPLRAGQADCCPCGAPPRRLSRTRPR